MTPRALSSMAQGRREHDWAQTSEILAYVHNSGFGCKQRVSGSELNPFNQTLSLGMDPRAVVLNKLDFWKSALKHQVMAGD